MTSLQSALKPKFRHFTRPLAGILSVAFTLPLFAINKPALAQVGGDGQACFAIADNNPPGNPDGGRSATDTLVRINFANRNVTRLANIFGPDNVPITNIEAATSRPAFNELIVADGNEIGRLDPVSGRYTPLGVLAPFTDFDAIAIDRRSPNQTRLLGVSKDRGNASLNNVIVEAILEIDSTGLATGISSITQLAAIPDDELPQPGDGLDGLAITDEGTVLGVANRGPADSDQVLVLIDPNTGNLEELGLFQAQDGSLIDDVEDISIDIFGDLFISSGSNFSSSADTAYVIGLNPDNSPTPARDSLSLASAGQDFEASACLPILREDDDSSLLVVKRITAITRNGIETRFDQFADQDGNTTDNRLSDLTNGTFPVGEFQTPTALLPGDEVEYTIYIYNPARLAIGDAVLCDPIQPPSVLQSSSVSFSEPSSDLALSFQDQTDFARAPLAPADSACNAALADDQFPSGPPGPTGGLDIGAGGGVVTDRFLLAPNQIAATRFRVTVRQSSL